MPSFITYTTTGSSGATLSPAYPTNQSGQLMLAFVNVLRSDLLSTIPVCTPPAGWTLVQDNGALGIGVYRAVWKKLGDGSTGFPVWSFDTTVVGRAYILLYGDIDTTTPVPVSGFYNDTGHSGINHPTGSLNTTEPNSLIIGAWFGSGAGDLGYDGATLESERINYQGSTSSLDCPTLIADDMQAAVGASGAKTAQSHRVLSPNTAQEILLVLNPTPNPSVPTVTYPHGGESLTAGAVIALACTAATSPTVAASSLQYEFSYSLDNGGSWNLIGLSPAGVAAKTWTVPATLGNTNLIRVRAYDGTLYSLGYGIGSAFSIIAETAPSVVIASPSAGAVVAKSAGTPIAWSYSGGPGNPQTQYAGDWATNSSFTSSTPIGPTSTALQSTTINTTGVTDGLTVYVRIKAKGVSLYSPYSVTAFIVASVPTTPNITAPTAGSPPTSANHTVTFTESSTFVARRFRVVQSGTVVWDTTTISSVLSFPSPYAFANGVAVTIYLSVQNIYGLWSAEDSETVTPSYTGPTKPTAVYTAVNDGGYVLAVIANKTPNYALTGTASASSTLAGRAASAVKDGIRNPSATEDTWVDDTASVFPDWISVDFGASRTINEIDVITRQDTLPGVEPTLDTTFTLFGIVDFLVQYWNGSTWATLATVTGNDKVWRQFFFSPTTTTAIRIWVTASADGIRSRVLELEAYGSESVGYNMLYSRASSEAKALAIPISPHLGANAQFEDHSPAHADGRIYFVRCYSGALFTDSDDSATKTLTLTNVWLHAVSRTNLSSNVLGLPVHMPHLIGSGGHSFGETQITVDLLGRDEPGAIFGEAIWEKQAITTFFRFTEQAMYDALLAAREATRGNATVLLIRDSLSNRFYCKMSGIETSIKDEGYDISLTTEETDYDEALL